MIIHLIYSCVQSKLIYEYLEFITKENVTKRHQYFVSRLKVLYPIKDQHVSRTINIALHLVH